MNRLVNFDQWGLYPLGFYVKPRKSVTLMLRNASWSAGFSRLAACAVERARHVSHSRADARASTLRFAETTPLGVITRYRSGLMNRVMMGKRSSALGGTPMIVRETLPSLPMITKAGMPSGPKLARRASFWVVNL